MNNINSGIASAIPLPTRNTGGSKCSVYKFIITTINAIVKTPPQKKTNKQPQTHTQSEMIYN